MRLLPASTEALGAQIVALAARLHAGTYELLVLLREFDDRITWNNGFASCAHWLHWRTGIALGAAREKVRVAHALATLPLVSSTMQRGAISYAKVRALTRVATPDNEASLLDFAQAGTAAQVERFVGAWRRVDRVAAAEAQTRYLGRQLYTSIDADGMVVIRGRLTPELGAVVQRALEAAADRLFREAQGEPRAQRVADGVTPAQRRADALGLLAESALASELDRGSTGDRYQVVLHVETPADAASQDLAGVLELDHGALHVSAETSRRLSCDAAVVRMKHNAEGAILDVGRKTRTVPPSIRRALQARDRGCRFPGCTARHCDAHHVEHWVDGGGTSLKNLVLLCRRHHRAVHEGGFEVRQHQNGTMTFFRADGTLLEMAPPLPIAVARLDESSWEPDDIPVSDGTPLSLAYAIDVLYAPPAVKNMSPQMAPHGRKDRCRCNPGPRLPVAQGVRSHSHRVRGGVASVPRAAEIIASFAAETQNYVASQCLAFRRRFEKSIGPGTDEATANEAALSEFEMRRGVESVHLAMVPGKDAFRFLNQALQNDHSISLTPTAVIDAMAIDEVPEQMRISLSF